MLSSVKAMASSRFGNEDPDAFRNDNLRSKKTGDSTKFALSVLREFMNARDKQDVDILSLLVEELNIIMKDFYTNVKSKTGEPYKKNSLLNIRQGLNRFLKDNDKRFDIISDSNFDTANSCFQLLLRKTRQVGKGAVQHHEAISRDDLQKLYKHPRALTPDTPLGLLNKLIFEVILYFCRRGQENLHTLKVSDFEIKIGADRYKYVQKITSELDKNHQGNSVISDIEGTGGKMYETSGNVMCPVAKGHNGTDRLFLHPKDSFVESESAWYRKEPIGANTMAEFTKRLSHTAELSTEYTNHCNWATTITLLNDSNI